MAQNFTDRVTQALQQAFKDAERRKNREVSDNHLLYAFLEDPKGYFYTVLSYLNGKSDANLSTRYRKI